MILLTQINKISFEVIVLALVHDNRATLRSHLAKASQRTASYANVGVAGQTPKVVERDEEEWRQRNQVIYIT